MDRVTQIKQLLAVLTPIVLEVHDDAADHVGHAHEGAGHFTVRVSSPQFEGKGRLQCHRLVYDALACMMPDHIHALRIEIIR